LNGWKKVIPKLSSVFRFEVKIIERFAVIVLRKCCVAQIALVELKIDFMVAISFYVEKDKAN